MDNVFLSSQNCGKVIIYKAQKKGFWMRQWSNDWSVSGICGSAPLTNSDPEFQPYNFHRPVWVTALWLLLWKFSFNFSLSKWDFNIVSSIVKHPKWNGTEKKKKGNTNRTNPFLAYSKETVLDCLVFLKWQSICEWESGESRDSEEQQRLKLIFLWNSSWNDRQQT